MIAIVYFKNETKQIIKNVTGFQGKPNVLTVNFTDPQGDQFVDYEMNTVDKFEWFPDDYEQVKNLTTAVSTENLGG